MSARYVHPSEDAVLAAMEKLAATGCKNGSRQEERVPGVTSEMLLTA
jgi:hypothetical protein